MEPAKISNATSLRAPWEAEILHFLPSRLQSLVVALPEDTRHHLEEIRLRSGQPLALGLRGDNIFLTPGGGTIPDPAMGIRVHLDEVTATWQRMGRFSIYALEEELRQGFLTVAGGHRIGFAGQFLRGEGRLNQVVSLNIRLSREIRGIASAVMPYLVEGGAILSTLILSPPQGGKTTLLRDLIRQVSSGVSTLHLRGLKVGVADERSELAGSKDGLPQLDLGPHTDVLDACPKADGLFLLLRALSPQVLATDELGAVGEAEAIQDAARAGVAILATVHAKSLEELAGRRVAGELVREKVFARYLILGSSLAHRTVEAVLDGAGRRLNQKPICLTEGDSHHR